MTSCKVERPAVSQARTALCITVDNFSYLSCPRQMLQKLNRYSK